MTDTCLHAETIEAVAPSGDGCVECLRMGAPWVHLRRCVECGHIGCCDSSPNRHATAHFGSTHHPLIQSYEPGEDWYWCYLDQVMFERAGEEGSPSHT
jgi:ubiquitin-hydrolase Zn-finger-containing protein